MGRDPIWGGVTECGDGKKLSVNVVFVHLFYTPIYLQKRRAVQNFLGKKTGIEWKNLRSPGLVLWHIMQPERRSIFFYCGPQTKKRYCLWSLIIKRLCITWSIANF